MPKEIHPYAVLREPIITEKSTELAEGGTRRDRTEMVMDRTGKPL